MLVEIGHWGGTYPHDRHAVRSLIAEHGPALGVDGPFAEFEPFQVDVLDPVRTTVEKLILLHAAATSSVGHVVRPPVSLLPVGWAQVVAPSPIGRTAPMTCRA